MICAAVEIRLASIIFCVHILIVFRAFKAAGVTRLSLGVQVANVSLMQMHVICVSDLQLVLAFLPS